MKTFTFLMMVAGVVCLFVTENESAYCVSDAAAKSVFGSQQTCADYTEFNDCGVLEQCKTKTCADFSYTICPIEHQRTINNDGYMAYGCQGVISGFDYCVQWRPCTGPVTCVKQVGFGVCYWNEEEDECQFLGGGMMPNGYSGCQVFSGF